MIFIDTVKANIEISRLNKELAEATKDKDLQVAKLKEYETKCKDYIESAQTAEAMKEAHAKEIAALKEAHAKELATKDSELVKTNEESEKTISTVKDSVAEEAIKIVASQGTNVVVDSVTKPTDESKPSVEKQSKVKFKTVSYLKK